MKIVVFGLTISSSWGNGHATLWRGLCRALGALGHRVVFFERDVPYYAGARDLHECPGGELVLYQSWDDIRARARHEIADADAAIATSYCPDARAASDLILAAPRALRVFYDLDTPITLSHLVDGDEIAYIGPDGLAGYDLVLSFTGGRALDELCGRLGAVRARPLYGHVDPDVHRPGTPLAHYRADLSYIGTYAADRQTKLEILFLEPAQRSAHRRFVIAGAQYPQDFPWQDNILFVRHLPPSEHADFFASSRFTLNVTRSAMARMGWCPSGRLFEATACGTAVLSDPWEGLEAFFAPGREVVVVDSSEAVADALELSDGEVARIAEAGRERTLAAHTSLQRARELIAELEAARAPAQPQRQAMEA